MDWEMVSNTESEVDRFMDEVLFEGNLSIGFHGFVIHTADDNLMTLKRHRESLKTLFSSFSEEELVTGLNHYIKMISSTKVHQKSGLLFSLLEYGAKNNYVSPRLVCETLLKSESFIYQNEDFWCLSCALMQNVIPNLDYKAVGDFFKVILEKACDIDTANNVSVMKQLRAIEKLLETIFDRNASLLPSYLILEEIQKKFAIKGYHSHWKFSKLISGFIDSFRLVAQMVSLSVFMLVKNEESTCGHSKLLPLIGYSSTFGNVWKVDPDTAKAPLLGPLPYNKELLEPQTYLLRYVLKQSYSKEMICTMLGIGKQQKQRCPVLEEQLAELIVATMDESGSDLDEKEDSIAIQLLWQHISSQLTYFVLFHYADFPKCIEFLHAKLLRRNQKKGRHYLMWVLLQFISGILNKKPMNDFFPVIRLYDLLYPEKCPLPIPDVSKASCVFALAPFGVWTHLMEKAQSEKIPLRRHLPIALTVHAEFLKNIHATKDLKNSLNTDYRLSILCNTYSNTSNYFSKPMTFLAETIEGTQKQSSYLKGPIKPLSMSILDSLTVHTKISMMNHISNKMIELARSKSTDGIAPAFIETYCRLMAYKETESMGLKLFIEHLLPTIYQNQAWSILHTLLEMFSYRLHHVPTLYQLQLLNHLQTMASAAQTNHTQLQICFESVALKIIVGLGNIEAKNQISKMVTKRKNIFFNDSEELNKAFVLTIAKVIRVTGFEILCGNWCNKILKILMQSTSHSWSSSRMECFPRVVADFFERHKLPQQNKDQMKRSVEEEYKKWKTMDNENDKIVHFSLQGSSPLFVCLMWKMILEQDGIPRIAYQILDRIGSHALSAHFGAFADFLVYEFSSSTLGHYVNKYIEALNDLIWKCHVIQLDRLILCLAMRNFEGNEAKVCSFIIHMIVIKPQEFKKRVYDFVKNNSPEHWKQTNWHEKHMVFHKIYKEKFYFEGLENINTTINSQHTYLPIYFGNICLRFLPVMDIVIHRFIEIPSITSAEIFLDELGCLYKFHDRPLTYLYETLHYYEQKLQAQILLKKRLVSTIFGALKDICPTEFTLSEDYLTYIQNDPSFTWKPNYDYYVNLIGRLVGALEDQISFTDIDWRFNEFQNQGGHALHVTCIELMALPLSTQEVGNALLDVIFKGRTSAPQSNIAAWMNAMGLVFTSLPKSYLDVLNNHIIYALQSLLETNPYLDMDPFVMFDFAGTYNSMIEVPCSYLIALTHSVWYHANIGQVSTLPQILKEQFKPAVRNETQFLYVCHLIAPLLIRFHPDRLKSVKEIAVQFFEMIEVVDENCDELQYIDAICDLFYHIKYNYIDDDIKIEIERSVKNLKPVLQHRLRFVLEWDCK